MPAQKLDLVLYDNDTLTWRLSIRSGSARTAAEAAKLPAFDLTGWGAVLQIRKSAAADEVLAEISTPALPGHVGTGIEIDAPGEGGLVLTFAHSLVTPAFIQAKAGMYDLLLIHPEGRPYRVMYGAANAVRGITRLSPELREIHLTVAA